METATNELNHSQPVLPEPPIVNMMGEHIALGPVRRELLPTYQRWINDFTTLRTLGGMARPMTMEQERAWYDTVASSAETIPFTIYVRTTWTPIGTTSLMGIDYLNRTADFGILIGEAADRGKGYGTETTRLMLDYAFSALGLHNVLLLVDEFNVAGRRAYTKAGFRECGRRRQCRARAGQRWDTIYMECLSSEFVSPVLARILAPEPSPS